MPKPDPDPVPRREAADHEQAHPPGYADVDHGRVVQPPVGVAHLRIGDADPAVGDVEEDTAAGQRLAGHVHLGVFGRECGRVLDQLRDEVHDVVDGLADNRDARLDIQHDPLVLLDLRDGRPEHVHQRDGLAPPPGRLVTRENQQVLRVAAHPGGQVVQPEQAAQPARVLLALLQGVDERDLPLNQGLAAAGQVDEHRVQVAAEHGLVGGQPDGFAVNLVEGPRHLTDLVGGGDGDRLDLDALVRALGLAQPAHHVRQPRTGDVERVLTQPAQRADHRPGDQRRDQQHADQQD